MSRVGRWTRKENQVRLIEIWNAIIKIQARKGFATVTDIGNEIGMGRSTWLKNLIFRWFNDGKIDCKTHVLIDGRDSYRFYFSDERIKLHKDMCKTPWLCDSDRKHYTNFKCYQTVHGIDQLCPVMIREFQRSENRKTPAPGTPAIRIPADKLVQ